MCVDGRSAQEKLLKEGFARVAYIMDPPYKYYNLFKTTENLAKRSKLMIWSRKDFVTTRGFNGWEPESETVNIENLVHF
jgi:micrococcal nuclease